ncbi:hypothetical protein PanWU01x14_061990 [Parasponia andersonii]|uniref:Uncharacterized protein n=1 Tax=Parasponia andersonii TaxID=3476 RepID=A0A2P5DIC0_PARAD|nr:hypothetical protein PanWU01x14_061990 [Parasponia andersonii]
MQLKWEVMREATKNGAGQNPAISKIDAAICRNWSVCPNSKTKNPTTQEIANELSTTKDFSTRMAIQNSEKEASTNLIQLGPSRSPREPVEEGYGPIGPDKERDS